MNNEERRDSVSRFILGRIPCVLPRFMQSANFVLAMKICFENSSYRKSINHPSNS